MTKISKVKVKAVKEAKAVKAVKEAKDVKTEGITQEMFDSLVVKTTEDKDYTILEEAAEAEIYILNGLIAKNEKFSPTSTARRNGRILLKIYAKVKSLPDLINCMKCIISEKIRVSALIARKKRRIKSSKKPLSS